MIFDVDGQFSIVDIRGVAAPVLADIAVYSFDSRFLKETSLDMLVLSYRAIKYLRVS